MLGLQHFGARASETRCSRTVCSGTEETLEGRGEANKPKNVRNKSRMKYSDLCILFFFNLILTLAFLWFVSFFFFFFSLPRQALSCAVSCVCFFPVFLSFFKS